jgi:RNA polymerase sigma factor (sigma-70 family)
MDPMEDYQKKLFPYAYNILGSAEEARDAIQEVMAKYVSVSKHGIENETHYLIKGVINQSINVKKRNKKIIGDHLWLPEPISTETPDVNLDSNRIITYSLLVLLEYLTPRERAVFILKEAFEYSHEEIAKTLSLSVENSRKLLSRAKNELKNRNEGFKTAPPTSSVFLQDYIRLIQKGDANTLAEMLSREIAVKTDGGKKIAIVSPFTRGIQAAVDLMLHVFKTYQKAQTIRFSQVNHQPALLFYEGTILANCQVFEFEISAPKIKRIYSIVDPDKLRSLRTG